MTSFEHWLERARRAKHYDPDGELPDAGLVTSDQDVHWLDPKLTGNPSRIGVLLSVPARTMELYIQEIPPGAAGDLQRHAHESVHYVIDGRGHSEIGRRTLSWRKGDLLYTPPWAWHRHYNDSPTEAARMLLVENSRLLEALGLHQRESAGEVSAADYLGTAD
jgi:quercetin dioxygenase-like cupin family protein